MVDSDDPDVVDLRDEAATGPVHTTETVRTRRPGLASGLAIAIAAAALALILLGDDAAPPDAPEPAPPSTAAPTTAGAALADSGRPLGATPGLRFGATAAIMPVDSDAALLLATQPIDEGVVDFVRVDSATGAAVFLDNRSLLGLAAFDDIRFFGPEMAVAQLVDGSYLTLAIGSDRVEVISLVDVTTSAAATPLGLEALSPDGRVAWVESPYGFFRWDLGQDRIVGRWLDRDGDLERLPRPRLAVGSGLVVEAGGDTYLVEGSTARRLDIGGEVVAGVDDWLLTRSCDDRLDCGDLELVDLASSDTVELPDERFRQRCGLMAPVPRESEGGDGAVVVVLQRFGSSAVVVADRGGVSSVTPLHPLPVGCLDASVLDDGRVVVFSDTTIAFVDGDDVEVVTTFPLGRTLAGTAATTGD